MSYISTVKIPGNIRASAKVHGVVKMRLEDGIFLLVYGTGRVDKPMTEESANQIVSASKDFKKKQEKWNSEEYIGKKKEEIRHIEHGKNQNKEKIVSANLRRILSKIR